MTSNKPKATAGNKSQARLGRDPLAAITGEPRGEDDTAAAAPGAQQPPDTPEPEAKATAVTDQQPVPEDTLGAFVLEPTLGIATASALHNQLLDLLDATDVCTIDASGVEMMDTAAIQVLAAFSLSAGQRGAEVRWQAPSEAFRTVARVLDLSSCFGLEGG